MTRIEKLQTLVEFEAAVLFGQLGPRINPNVSFVSELDEDELAEFHAAATKIFERGTLLRATPQEFEALDRLQLQGNRYLNETAGI
jgi:hypothetical protein